MAKIVVVLIDGVGTEGLELLNYKTILQGTPTPNLDLLAKAGITGILDSVQTGKACGSDTAHLNIFGYNPFELYRGRGSFETMGAGIPMTGNDIAFKCNFALVNEEGIVVKRRCDRQFDQWGLELIDFINGMKIPGYEGYEVKALHATEHRIGLSVCGPGLTDTIIGTDPLVDGRALLECKPKNQSEESIFTCELVKALSAEIVRYLTTHPLIIQRKAAGQTYTNIVLLRGCGQRLKCPSFTEKHNLTGFMIAPTAIIAGIGMTLDMDLIKVEGTTGDQFTNLTAKYQGALPHIPNYDFGFIHIKAYDDFAHDMDPEGRIQMLIKIDKMVGDLVAALEAMTEHSFVLCVTGDHSTTNVEGDHTFEPVPFMCTGIRMPDMPTDQVERFDEISCSKGKLGRICGNMIMPLLKHFREMKQV